MTLYWNDYGADACWDNSASWWEDADCTVAHGAMPENGDSVHILANMSYGPGNISVQVQSIYVHAYVTLTSITLGNILGIVMADYSVLDGIYLWSGQITAGDYCSVVGHISVSGTVTAGDYATVNMALADGDVVVGDHSTVCNMGAVNGDIYLNGGSSFLYASDYANTGVVYCTAAAYYVSPDQTNYAVGHLVFTQATVDLTQATGSAMGTADGTNFIVNNCAYIIYVNLTGSLRIVDGYSWMSGRLAGAVAGTVYVETQMNIELGYMNWNNYQWYTLQVGGLCIRIPPTKISDGLYRVSWSQFWPFQSLCGPGLYDTGGVTIDFAGIRDGGGINGSGVLGML